MTKLLEHDVIVNGLRLHYLEAGEGTPLVLLHGTAIDSARLSFGSSFATFAKGFRVLALDWPGYGDSEYPPKTLGIRDYTQLLEGFIQHLSLGSIHLLGFSMGGAVALGYALGGASLRSLTLVSSYGLGTLVHVPLVPYVALRVPRLATSVWAGLRLSKTLTSLALRYLIFARPSLVTPALVDEVYTQLKRPQIEQAFMRWIRGEIGIRHLRSNFHRELSQLNVPTLLLHGSRDLVIPAAYAKKAAEQIPHATLQVVPRCGHWLMREQPQVFEGEVSSFLRSLPNHL
jgi:pimeloyl-ACP methyl ester carboxylesterase